MTKLFRQARFIPSRERERNERLQGHSTGRLDKILAGPVTNCLHCKLYDSCENPKKNWKYVCQKFKALAKNANNITALDILKVGDKKPNQQAASIDFQEMIERMISQESSSPLPPDLRIDDGDLPLAKNFFEFTTSPRYLNIKPYAKQLEAAIHLFAEFCPLCSDMKYIFNVPKRDSYDDMLNRIQLLHHGKCPRCQTRKSELYNNGDLKVPVELAGLAGQRSGKSAGSVMITAYTLHRYLKLQNASQAFNLLDIDDLQGTLVAQTWEKAREKLYNPLHNYIIDKPWFKQYNQMLDHYGERYGEKLYKINDIFASYRVRNLLIRPHGPDKRKLRGDTSFCGVIDELGWFDASEGSEKKVKQSSSEIYTAMRNAFRTLRSGYYRLLRRGYDNMPPPTFCNISSPSSKRDQMVRNYEKSQTSKYIHGFHFATWEFNPTLSRRDFDDDFATDEAKAWRDFGAVPPNSAMPYVASIDDLVGIINRRLRNTVSLAPRTIISGSGREMRSGKLRFHTQDQNKRLMAIDPGYNNNCLAGETKIITKNGTKKIKHLTGPVEILTRGGEWVIGNFASYGRQYLYDIELKRNNTTKIIRATGHHRWFALNKHNDEKELTTKNLDVGYRLISEIPQNLYGNLTIDNEGIEHGIVFGDGTIHHKEKYLSRASLVDYKISFLRPYFLHYKKRGKYWYNRKIGHNRILQIENLPGYYKKLPDNNTPEYLLGFLSGYISTDGHVDKSGRVMLNSSKRKNLQFVRDICNSIGIVTSNITYKWESNLYRKDWHKNYKIFFYRPTFPTNLLLNPIHRKRFIDNKIEDRSINKWTVKSITKTNIKEEVYCAQVPKTHSFVLEDYILTGNSFAAVAGYLDGDTNRPVFDTFIEIQPTAEFPINYNDIYENVLGPMTDKLNIKMWVTDRWQNLKLLHDAEADFGVETEQYSTRYSDFESIRQDFYENYITIPKPEMKKSKIELAGEQDYPHGFLHAPVAHFIYQVVTVRDIGKSVEKGDGTTDDLFRALVTAYSFIIDADYKEFCTGKTNQLRNGNPFGGAWGPRGGESGASNGSTSVGDGVVVGSNGPIGLVASFGANRR